MYAQVHFSMNNFGDSINFFLENCQVELGSTKVKIIQTNCYSTAARGNNHAIFNTFVKINYFDANTSVRWWKNTK